MHLGLVGCSSAGKTTLANAIITASREQGISADLSEDFVLRRLHLGRVSNPFLRRRILELASFAWLTFGWRHHRRYLGLTLRLIAHAPGGWLYRLGLFRLTVRKLGMHALIEGAVPRDHIVVSDNEATLQAAHHLMVHPAAPTGKPTAFAETVEELARLSPRPDLVAYVRVPEADLVERMMRRGHGRLGLAGRGDVTRFVAQAVETFEALCASPYTDDYLFVIEPRINRVNSSGTSSWPAELESVLYGALEALGGSGDLAHDVCAGSGLVEEVMTRLEQNEIAYCCLDNGYPAARARSEGLSLLVEKADEAEARRLLGELGFKEVPEGARPSDRAAPAYFGLDRSTGELVWVRLGTEAAFRIGPTSGYRLPLEDLLLTEVQRRGLARIPTFESALILFVLRTVTEGWADTADEVRAEVRWLASRCSMEEVLRLVDLHCPWLGRAHFLEGLHALYEGASRIAQLRLSWRLRRTLRRRSEGGWLRGGPAAGTSWLSGQSTAGAGTPRTLPSGGVVVALVGPDATGKSTLASDVVNLLRPHLRVDRVHLGKPPPSPWTWGVNMGVRVLQTVRGRRPRWKPKALEAPGAQSGRRVGLATLLYAVRAVALAYDRRRALLRAVRLARQGAVVVCDRYPNQVVGAMDGPRLPADGPVRGVLSVPYHFLARREQRLYDRLPPPDVLIRLSVSIEEARRRNREREKADKHTEAELEERHSLPPVAWPVREDRVKHVDTGRPLDESRLSVRRAVWAAL